MLKKCVQKKSSTPNKAIVRRQSSKTGIVSSAISYTPPVFRDAPSYPYIEFYCFDPDKGKLRRKRIKTKKFAKMKNRRQYINGIIERLTDQLMHGWNPWIADNVSELTKFSESLSAYENFVERMFSGGNFRKQTYARYKSNINVLREYASNIKPIYYTYQYNKRFCVDFLDYIFIERNNCAQTRNNYLVFLKVLSGFFVEKGYLDVRPTDGIAPSCFSYFTSCFRAFSISAGLAAVAFIVSMEARVESIFLRSSSIICFACTPFTLSVTVAVSLIPLILYLVFRQR